MIPRHPALFLHIVLVFLATILLNPHAIADTYSEQLDTISARNKLIVGVKADYPPWGFYDEKANIVGLEPALAREIADKMGVELQLQRVDATDRIGQLESGAIDLLIATISDTEQRRKQTGILEPSYYSSGATLLTPPDGFTPDSWADLYRQPICLTRNAFFNRDLIENFLLDPKIFNNKINSLAALEFSKCIGWIYDDSAIAALLKEDKWKNYQLPLNTIMSNPWAIAVKSTEKNTAFGILISGIIAEWHRSGRLLELEKKWGLRNSQYLIDQNKRWNAKNPQGVYICKRLRDHSYPLECLDRNSIAHKTAKKDTFLSSLGINFPPEHDTFSQTLLLKGIGLTLLLSLSAMIGSLVCGIIIGLTLYRLPSAFSWIAARLNDIFRMTPPLLN